MALYYLVRNLLAIDLVLVDDTGNSVLVPPLAEHVVQARFIDFRPPSAAVAEWVEWTGPIGDDGEDYVFSPLDGMYVRFDRPQILTEIEKARVRNTIGVGLTSNWSLAKLFFGSNDSASPMLKMESPYLAVRAGSDDAYLGLITKEVKFPLGTRIIEAADGSLTLRNTAGNNIVKWNFGGITNAYASIKSTGPQLEVRLGDDTDLAPLAAKTLRTVGANSGIYVGPRTSTGDFIWYNPNGADLRLSYGGSDIFSITNTGVVNFGAGLLVKKAASGRAWALDATDLLGAENSAASSINVITPDANSGFLVFSDASARARGYVQYDHPNDALRFAVAGTLRWQLNTAGSLIAETDATVDIGLTAGNRPRDIHITRKFANYSNTDADGPAYLANSTTKTVDEFAFAAQRTGVSKGGITTDGRLVLYNLNTVGNANYERGGIEWSGNALFLRNVKGGTGVARDITISSQASLNFLINNGTSAWKISTAGHLLGGTDNTFDIGASGATRPRSVYVGTDVVAGGNVSAGTSGALIIGSRSKIVSGADGTLMFTNNAGNNFNLLILGLATTSYVALKTNAAVLQARLGDDSAFANFEAKQITARTGGFVTNYGTSTSGADHIALVPTDYGVGKPYLYVRKNATATQWDIGLFDSASAAGLINFVGTEIRVNGLPIGRQVATTALGASGAGDGANTWAKIATINFGTNNQDAQLLLAFTQSANDGPSAALVSVFARVNLTSSANILAVGVVGKHGGTLADDSFKLISNTNTSAELWIKKTTINAQFAVTEVSRALSASTTVTYNANAAWQATTPTGSVTNALSAVATQTDLSLASAGVLTYGSRTKIQSTADGYLLLTNNAVTDFTMLRFGGSTSAFPGLKRAGTVLQVRLGDDSGYAGIAADTVEANGLFTSKAGQVFKTRVVTAAGGVTVATSDYVVIINKTVAATSAVTLPAGVTGQTFIIKDGKGDAASFNITITPAAGNIDGAASLVLNTNYGAYMLVYNGTQWNALVAPGGGAGGLSRNQVTSIAQTMASLL